ncbi:HNH endonuclease [Mesorhizobium sp. M0085]|uniref:HNH endonuclease n=1 Tax=Mesorhizobium sp. M0085 TaxID=2956872 RepID=UPI00333A7B0D
MMYLEMSRDDTHGGGSWGFTKCAWAPVQKENGSSWPFWSKVGDIEAGDVVLHLRGVPPHAEFVGYSIATSDGYSTADRPPEPKGWSFSAAFYRAELEQFIPFEAPINLNDLFKTRREPLETYFEWNRGRGGDKRNIFFVRQARRLQCLNGAYLSEVDDELFYALFDEKLQTPTGTGVAIVRTASVLSEVRQRVGQQEFARAIKALYGGRCCFPDCSVDDHRFLVASHIARWSDNPSLRGHTGNGLCLCLTHDRAFELGLYTLDAEFRIHVNPAKNSSSVLASIARWNGRQVRLASTLPLHEALLEHWVRTAADPMK